MADTDALKKYLDAGMAFTHLTRARAEQVVKDLVAAGELQRSQTKGAIDELLDRSRKNAETLAEQVRKEVDSQLASLGLARKADVERLEAELAELKGGQGGGKKSGGGRDDGGAAPSEPAPAKKAAKKSSGDGETKAFEEAWGSGGEGGNGGGEASSDHSTPAKKTGKSSAPAKPARKDEGEGGGDGTGDRSTPAKKAGKSSAPAKTTKKAAAGASPIDSSLPGRKDKDESGDDVPAPAKKATKAKAKAKEGGDAPSAPADKAMPAKKTARKQG